MKWTLGVIPCLCLVLLSGCEAEPDSSSTGAAATLSSSTAYFVDSEVIASESKSRIEIKVGRESLGPVGPIDIVYTGTATQADYRVLSGVPVSFPAGVTTVNIVIELLEDSIREGGESLILTLAPPNQGTIDRERDRFFVGITGHPNFLNDTGMESYLAGVPAEGQDASTGLDLNSVDFDGNDGFVFSAIDSGGNPTQPPAPCVRDGNTGLTWTSPTSISDIPWPTADRANATNTYTWYQPDELNGGAPGARPGTRSLDEIWPLGGTCAFPITSDERSHPLHCDTLSLVEEFNSFGVCSYKNFRLPTLPELVNIIDYDPEPVSDTSRQLYEQQREAFREIDLDPASVNDELRSTYEQIISTISTEQKTIFNPPFDPVYWPNVLPGKYATSTPAADGTASILCILYDGLSATIARCNKQEPTLRALLVRSPQQDELEQ